MALVTLTSEVLEAYDDESNRAGGKLQSSY